MGCIDRLRLLRSKTDGSGALRPTTCRYGLSRGASQDRPPAPGSSGASGASGCSSHPAWRDVGHSDIVRAAHDRNTRNDTTGRALDEARRALSDTFTLGRRSPKPEAAPSEAAGQWPWQAHESFESVFADASSAMWRPGGERKVRLSRVQEPRLGMMVRGRGYQHQENAEQAAPTVGAPASQSTPTNADRERQRIRATMASMRHELLDVGAASDAGARPPPSELDSPQPSELDSPQSSGLLEEAASRCARMRQSRELRRTAGVQSTGEVTWGARKTTPARRPAETAEPPSPPPPAAPERGLFTRLEPQQVARAVTSGSVYSHPVAQCSVGFDRWSVRRPSAAVAAGVPWAGEPPPPAVDDRRRELLGDLEIVDDDTMGDLVSNFGTMGGQASMGRSPVKGTPISEQEGCSLKELMFGSTGISFSQEWTVQNLTFNKTENITYGLVQHKGGPCGVMAALQAYVLKVLLFGSRACVVAPAADAHRPSGAEQRAALAAAIAEILWKCGHDGATVAMSSVRSQFPGGGRYKSDGITETLQLETFSAVQPLAAYVRDQLQRFMAADGAGCILLIYSAALSRGIDSVRQDMDVPTSTLIGRHGYCTQELVNLLLTGKATSNVFNGTVRLGEGKDVTVLRGVDSKSEMGLLSLFEHYKSCEVGSHLKSPRLPIWVILSESHFTCLFTADGRLCGDQPVAGKFCIFYYDMLARQDDEIRLTVDYDGDPHAEPPAVRPGELVPPLEHCLRTRWAGARVSWNGYEPIL